MLLPLAVAHVVGGGGPFAWVVMYGAVSVSFLLLRLASKKTREVPPCACIACFFSLSRPLASCPHICCCRACFCVDARARAATANLGLLSSYDAALVTQALQPAYCLPSVPPPLFLVLMADAAQAAPRHQRRKEARAQTDEDVRRVRQRMDEADGRLDTLEGRLRGHDLRLQYLEAPLKLVLKKFKAPVEFWAAKDSGFQAAKSAFSAAFIQELRDAGGVTVQHGKNRAGPYFQPFFFQNHVFTIKARKTSTPQRNLVFLPHLWSCCLREFTSYKTPQEHPLLTKQPP